MAEISRATLFGKLNPLMFKAAEGAVTFCKLRGNPHVDLTHWRFQIVNLPDSDLHRILRHFEVDSARLVRDLQTMLERLPRGASVIEDFAENLPFAVKEGWMYATLLFGESQVRSGYLLVGLLKTDRLREGLLRISREFEKVKVETLTEDFARIVKGSPEDHQAASDGFAPGTPGEASHAIPPAAMGKQEALRRYASDLTARARAGQIDPVTGDAANLLKPALARGTLRTIAATTWAEYKKYIEKDPALTRRFQVVQVLEPTESKALLMLRGVASTLEKHHRVQLLDEALDAAVKLSHRYIPARQLPDKAVSLLDTTCARVAVSQQATPPEVEDSRRRIEALQTELDIIAREEAAGFAIGSRRADAEALMATEKDRLAGLEQRWTEERNLVDRILELRRQLRDETEAKEPAAREARLTELRELQSTLAKAQGDAPLILPSVDGQAVAAVVSDWTGIPVGRMVKNEVEAVLKLVDTLATRVVGQRHGLEMIARRIQTSRARLDDPEKPIGVFLLVGPSGVGKTETALALAESLYGGQDNVITINMSEFQEAHTVST